MTQEKVFRLCVGAICDPIAKQIKSQGLVINDKEALPRFQKIHDSIVMLKVHGFIPESIATKASQKLSNQIGKKLKSKP
jgi:hypothetical protein